MAQYVYTMSRVGKVVPPNREILKDISLSFFPGAKIGVLGLNGSGKSSLLRIMAGIDKEHLGEARPQAELKIGYLAQEPELDESKDVRGNVEDGVREIKDIIDEFNAISDRFAEPLSDNEMAELMDRQGELQLKIDAVDGWDLERKIDVAADALRLPAYEADVSTLSGGERRRVALCRLLLANPDMLLLDEPTNHLDAESVAWLEQFLQEFPGTVVAITHDRYFLDNAAARLDILFSSGGNYSQFIISGVAWRQDNTHTFKDDTHHNYVYFFNGFSKSINTFYSFDYQQEITVCANVTYQSGATLTTSDTGASTLGTHKGAEVIQEHTYPKSYTFSIYPYGQAQCAKYYPYPNGKNTNTTATPTVNWINN